MENSSDINSDRKRSESENVCQLIDECDAMIAHSLDAGLNVPSSIFSLIERFKSSNFLSWSGPASYAPNEDDLKLLAELVGAHNQLAEIVRPATPTSITFLAEEERKSKRLGFLFPKSLSVARTMTFLGVSSLILFCVILILYPRSEPNATANLPIDPAVLLWTRFLDVLYSLVAAALGASFLALYQANTYIVARTFDPKYISSYYYRFVLGLMAGMMLAYFLPGFLGQGGENSAAKDLPSLYTRPVLAMVGGFSASVVYRVLFRLVDALESLVRGETKDVIDAQVQQEKTRIKEQASQDRLQLTGNLVSVQRALLSGDNALATSQLNELVESLLPKKEG